MNINLSKIFPTPIWDADLGINNKELYDWCKQFREIDANGVAKANKNGWHSKDILLEEHLHVSPVKDLFSAIMEMTNQATSDYNYKNTNPIIKIANSWININDTKECYTETHVHPGSVFSGVYYVKCTEDSGLIKFDRNFYERFLFHCHGAIEESSELSAEGVLYKPIEGRLLLFPSYLPHSVGKNLDDSERVSISFNIHYSSWGYDSKR